MTHGFLSNAICLQTVGTHTHTHTIAVFVLLYDVVLMNLAASPGGRGVVWGGEGGATLRCESGKASPSLTAETAAVNALLREAAASSCR